MRWMLLAGIGLVFLTPFVVTQSTIYPFVVGKAIWSRSFIEIVFALWVLLALADPAYRPPRSRLLLLLAVGLGVALLAAGSGVSFQHSLWSNYERMQGVVDLAHWFAFALVLMSVVRTRRAMRTLLAFAGGASTAMACIVLARHLDLWIPFFGSLAELHLPRMSGPFGNPTYLGVYMISHLFIAGGLAIRSCLALPGRPRSPYWWILGSFWTISSGLHLWVLALAGSAGALVGMLTAVGFLMFAWTLLARGVRRLVPAGALAALSVAVLMIGLRVTNPDRLDTTWADSPLSRVAKMSLQHPSVQSRLAAWDAGLDGFVERPLLGWGPGNYGTVFGRFASGYGAVMEPHDQAHSKLVEVAATTGALGVLAYLALWGWTFLVVWRAARQADARDRAMVLFVGAAMTSCLVATQFLFDTAGSWLLATVFLVFAAGLEATEFPGTPGSPRPGRPWTATKLLRRRDVPIALGIAAVVASVAGLAVHRSIYAAANVRNWPSGPSSLPVAARGIEGFLPLANTYRAYLIYVVGARWETLRTEDAEGARRLLAWVEDEAAKALRKEPENWRLMRGLARMYGAVAATDPAYVQKARRAIERARALAPNRTVFTRALNPPQLAGAHRRDDGRHELRWRGSDGAGYHIVAELHDDGTEQVLLYSYDLAQTSFVRPGLQPPGVYRYKIRACRPPSRCTNWVNWPPLREPVPVQR